MPKGKVYIVGAGPGDSELITIKAMECLRKADVVLYDRLANDELLANCKSEAELMFVGKAAGKHYVKQDETIRIMTEKAFEGKTVVRLKGGDPYIFGRGSEEALAMHQENIDFEVIPGITAAIGTSSYAGIPLTHRKLVTQTIFITAHEAPGKEEGQVDWAKLAKLENTTFCIYMGVSKINEVVKTLIANGLSPETPSAAVQNGTLTSQRIISTNLSELPAKIDDNNFRPPVLTIIGPTAALSNSLSWFEKKPLFGKRIVSPRAQDQKLSLYKILTEKGAEVISFSVIKTDFSIPEKEVRSYLENNYDWIVFTSENGVRYFFDIMFDDSLDARSLGTAKIASIGTGTGRKLREYNIIPDFIPTKFTSASLLEELNEFYNIENKKFLRVKGNFQNDPLTKGLLEQKAKVDTIEVYKLMKDTPDQEIIDDLVKNGADAFLFTSISTVNNFFSILGKKTALDLLNNGIPLAIGPVTAGALRDKGVINIKEADEHTIHGMATKLEDLLGNDES